MLRLPIKILYYPLACFDYFGELCQNKCWISFIFLSTPCLAGAREAPAFFISMGAGHYRLPIVPSTFCVVSQPSWAPDGCRGWFRPLAPGIILTWNSGVGASPASGLALMVYCRFPSSASAFWGSSPPASSGKTLTSMLSMVIPNSSASGS